MLDRRVEASVLCAGMGIGICRHWFRDRGLFRTVVHRCGVCGVFDGAVLSTVNL